MMKSVLSCAVALTLLGTAAFAADPVEGNWRTIADDNGNSGLIQVKACGDKICGTLIKSFDASGAEFESDNNGRRVIWDMVARGNGNYDSGKVYSPDRDKTYNGKLSLSGNNNELTVKGCLFKKSGCRSGGTWTRQ